MAIMQITDKKLSCSACGDRFVFTAGEQEFLVLRGVQNDPHKCPTCVRYQQQVRVVATTRR